MKGLLLLLIIVFCSFCTVNAHDPAVISSTTVADEPHYTRALITFERLPEPVKDAHFGNEKKMEGLAVVEVYVVSNESAVVEDEDSDVEEVEATYEIIAIDDQGMNVVFTYDAYGNLQDIESDRMS